MTLVRCYAIDFHVHTSYSFDCLTPPQLVIEAARRRGLDAIAVTDHDTIRGALATVEVNRYNDFLVIPGIEVKSDRGDIIGLYVTREIKSRSFDEVIREIHDQGALVYLPHPIRTFGSKGSADVRLRYPEIKLWERYNGRYSASDFEKADDLFGLLPMPPVLCGSDAHFCWEVGLFRTLLPELPRTPQALLACSNEAQLDAAPRAEFPRRVGITLGEATKELKAGEYLRLGLLLASLPWKLLQYSLRGKRSATKI